MAKHFGLLHLRFDFLLLTIPPEKAFDDAGLQTQVDDRLGFRYLSDAIEHEIRVFWYFTWRDWSASLIPGMMYTVAAIRALDSTLSADHIARSLGRSLIYFFLYIYAFDIANQINGVAEDRVNKPDRPIPSGRCSVKGAYIRWYATSAAHLALGAAWGVLPWTALWVFITVYTSFYGGDKHWTTKNLLFMSTGSLCLLQASWGLVAPITARETRWAVLLSAVFGIVASVQDMRDVEGDKVAGRRTLPIVLGGSFRWVMAAVICAAPLICWQLEFLRYSQMLVGYCGAVLALAMFYMAYRVVRGYSRKYDHKTYMVCYSSCSCDLT
ncbi:UbiA prenyltransferase family-domain-containing protein [Mycena pura]|uniref:UbiA prenyltransferase family-domain-containing protein n=1 Tax=Mycena pura TaxID=153505 RepID=A0AAD6YKJ7_9AGAR|nr:UbiA prenyltransferase family-domain-containing protein [Mycena pura]